MIKGIGKVLLGVFLFFCGLGMIEMAVTDPEFDVVSSVFAVICGLIFAVSGIAVVGLGVMDIRMKTGSRNGKKKRVASEMAKELRSSVSPGFAIVQSDENKMEELLRTFRKDYGSFFSHAGVTENDAIQKDATQLYWHILSLQKNRLDRKGIRLDFSSERLSYGDIASVRKNSYFDGKYKITDVSETIEAKTVFSNSSGKKLKTRKCLESACYRILGAETNQYTQMVCPNCGQMSTKDDLIDGCDYCGTKFTIEDLDDRVSEFTFRKDPEVEYSKYVETRSTYIPRVALIVGIPIFILCAIGVISVMGDFEGAYTLRIAGAMFAAAFPTAAAIFFAELFFILFLLPILQAGASIRYASKRMIRKLKDQEERNGKIANQIQSFDKYFSLNGFYSGLQNKLSLLHFAQGAGEAAAFVESKSAEEQVAAVIGSYQDVIDMQVDEIRLDGYAAGEYMQELGVTVKLTLLSENGGSVSKKKETVRMVLVKDSKCKTQAVCAPSFTNCKQCGAPMSLLAGRVCPYCGNARRLADYDWAIRTYQVIG